VCSTQMSYNAVCVLYFAKSNIYVLKIPGHSHAS